MIVKILKKPKLHLKELALMSLKKGSYILGATLGTKSFTENFVSTEVSIEMGNIKK